MTCSHSASRFWGFGTHTFMIASDSRLTLLRDTGWQQSAEVWSGSVGGCVGGEKCEVSSHLHPGLIFADLRVYLTLETFRFYASYCFCVGSSVGTRQISCAFAWEVQ